MRIVASDCSNHSPYGTSTAAPSRSAFYEDWLDVAALNREALRAVVRRRQRPVRTAPWDATSDQGRAGQRARRATLRGCFCSPARSCSAVDSRCDLTVHLAMSAAALARRTPADLAWTLPASTRYADEVAPAEWADVVVRLDDPRHPAVVDR